MSEYSRVIVDPPRDRNQGPVRARSPIAIADIRAQHASGARPRDLARVLGVSLRTVYRYLADDSAVITVRIGRWEAEFAFAGDDRIPRRVTRWRRVIP